MADDALRLEYVALSTAVLWEQNYKLHDIDVLIGSIEKHGFKDPPKFEPLLNSGAGGIVEGNGRTIALKQMHKTGQEPPRGIEVSDGEWFVPILFGVDAQSELAAEAYGVDHNATTIAGRFELSEHLRLWDDGFIEQLKYLQNGDEGSIAFDQYDLSGLFDLGGEGGYGDGEGGEKSDGSLLELVNITVNDPENTVEPGDVWRVGNHLLICCDILTEWDQFTKHLQPGDVFAPYPGPFVPLSEKAKEMRLVMVQPDTYIAGHILDRYSEQGGEIEKC